MRPLTDTTPKPLIMAGRRRLIEHHLYHLARAGFSDVVINVAWLGQQIMHTLGNGEKYHLNIAYCDEGDKALETGGGIFNALPLLGDTFLVVNGDVWTDYPFERLGDRLGERLGGMDVQDKAHLVLVNNPEHNPQGDFALCEGRLSDAVSEKYTYSGIGLYTRAFFEAADNTAFPLAPMIRAYISENKIGGELYQGRWMDIGTQQRLDELVEHLGCS
ncbi:Glucose-1-phosphate thymidylyltransferase [hydrothermal vent metagenome]|uniref:Glucose-1-phosphate thymidylyltransferase n=1 Tax=hydrothermal vent metagenome TaxID=652676 RepID=A0A3B0YFM1_9ZZZZ